MTIMRVRQAANDTPRSFPTRVDAFLCALMDLDCRKQDEFIVAGRALTRERLLEELRFSSEPVPERLCGPLALPVGATYGAASRQVLTRERRSGRIRSAA